MKSFVCWNVTLCGLMKVNRRFGGTYHLNRHGWEVSQAGNASETKVACFMMDCSLTYYSTLTKEVTCCSATSVCLFHWTAWWRHIPEVRTVHFYISFSLIKQKYWRCLPVTSCVQFDLLNYKFRLDRLCGLVVRVLGYRSGGPGSIPGTTRKKK
jgi:hypothetical protein